MRFTFLLLAIALASGCTPNPPGTASRDVRIRFAAVAANTAVTCGQPLEAIGTTAATAELLDARLYVSNVQLLTADGTAVDVELIPDGRWQVDRVALLDFEDGTAACSNGTAELNETLEGRVPEGTYVGLRFEVGVPFELNHDDLAAADPPLNLSAMYWTWAIGHKFVRVDLETTDGMRWNMHLGSTMCTSDGPTSPPAVSCERPNRPIITLPAFDVDTDTVGFDLAALFANSDLTTDTPDTASGCQSFPDDVSECTPLFPTLGLDFSSGRCVDQCGNQQVFTVR